MLHSTISVVALGIGIGVSCQVRAESYLFQGVFAPTDRSATTWGAPSSPSELMGQPFTIAVSWPANAAEYSSDGQTGANYWGSYGSESISIDIDVPGFDFSVPPTIARRQTFNDATLDYRDGVPQLWGDELRLDGRVVWSRSVIDWRMDSQDNVQSDTFTGVTPFILTLRAVDITGTHFVDDLLQTRFDLTSFTNVRFEFKQIVPVAGGDPRPVGYQHWIGTVESIVAVPEPTSRGLTSLTMLCLYLYRRRTKR